MRNYFSEYRNIYTRYTITRVVILISIQISIKKGVYDKLKALKAPGDSFSDVIERLFKGQSNLHSIIECHGILRDHNE